MTDGNRKRRGWGLDETLNKITMASSKQDVWWLTGLFAVTLQRLISRWAHGGHRKHFQTHILHGSSCISPAKRWRSIGQVDQ
jgi:hypothetical protein